MGFNIVHNNDFLLVTDVMNKHYNGFLLLIDVRYCLLTKHHIGYKNYSM